MKETRDILNHPVDRDNEALILSNAIKNKENRDAFVRKLTYEQFRLKEFQTLAWGVIEAEKAKMDINIDAVLLKSKSCPVRYLVDFSFIQQVVDNFPELSIQNFLEHVEKLAVDNVKQRLIDWMMGTLYPACTDPSKKLMHLNQRFTYGQEILGGAFSASKLGFKTLEEVAHDYDEAKLSGVDQRTTGFSQLDALLTEGFKDGQITTIAGLSSAGKSSFALSVMRNLSQASVPTAQFALEMNNMSLFSKLLSFRTRLPMNRVIKKPEDLEPEERKLYEWEKEQLAKNKYIYLNDTPSQSIASIREQIMLLQDSVKQQYFVVVIDLFGKIRDLQSSDNFARDYEKKLNEIQILVRELGVHMILVAQINKEVSKRKNKRPTMNDLKNAGAITEVSDIVIGIHRPYHDPELALKTQLAYGLSPTETDEESSENDDNFIEEDPNKNIAEVIILKQRMGPKDVLVNFTFDPVTTGFYPITESYQRQLNRIKMDEEM